MINTARIRRTSEGFTLVELIIVIVVIGILAAIILVAYNGITVSAQKTAIASELKQWEKLFNVYKATNGNYPLPVAPPANPVTSGGPGENAKNRYCLGTGFPTYNGNPYCYGTTNGPYQVAESTGTYLMSQLSTVGTPPTNSTKYSQKNVVGPFYSWEGSGVARLYGLFPPATDCEDLGLTAGNGDTNRKYCYIQLNDN